MIEDLTNQSLVWLRRVAGVDEDDIARYDPQAWNQWALAMNAHPNTPNPQVPEWMREHLGRWHQDFSAPYPTVAQLSASRHDWIAEADLHDDFDIDVDSPLDSAGPTLEQVRVGWSTALEHGAEPMINMTLTPARPWGASVTGFIDAFYVVLPDDEAAAIARLDDALGFAGTRSSIALRASSFSVNGDAEPAGDGPHVVRAWEWMYG